MGETVTDRSNQFAAAQKSFQNEDAFVFQGINLAKVLYDYVVGKYRTPVYASKKSRVRGTGKLIVYPFRFVLFWGKIAFWRIRRRGKDRILYFGSPRATEIDGVRYDLYNPAIVESIGRERMLILEEQLDTAPKQYSADLYSWDLIAPLVLLRIALRLLWRGRLRAYSRKVLAGNPDLPMSRGEIEFVVVRYWSWLVLFRPFIRAVAPHHVLIICHYGVHALITACKEHGVRTTELMHGSILKLHPHYGSPFLTPGFRKAFAGFTLPDDIGVYGQHWKENLLEGGFFTDSSVFVLGYYLKVPERQPGPRTDPRTTILISTQAPFQGEWVEYVRFLARTLDRGAWRVIVKPHPNERDEAYRELVVPGFVEVRTNSVYDLLPECQIHLSVRSTVLYEAVRYGLVNYVLLVERVARECREILESGIALPLRQDQVPLSSPTGAKDPSYFFAEYDESALFGRLTGAGGKRMETVRG